MKKIPLFLLILAFYGLLVLTSCSAPAKPSAPSAPAQLSTPTVPAQSSAPAALTADQVLQKLMENSRNLESGHINLVMEMGAQEEIITSTSNGVFKNPDRLFVDTEFFFQTGQILSLSISEVYFRQYESDSWQETDAAALLYTGSLFDFTRNPRMIEGMYQNARLLEETPVRDCSDCYHVGFEMDLTKFIMKTYTSQSDIADAETLQEIFKEPSRLELWIDKTDFFILRHHAAFPMVMDDEDVAVELMITLTEINQPVTIPTP